MVCSRGRRHGNRCDIDLAIGRSNSVRKKESEPYGSASVEITVQKHSKVSGALFPT